MHDAAIAKATGGNHPPLRLAPAPIHGHYDLLDQQGEVIALSVPPEHAARMVVCWNSHDELVEALRDVLRIAKAASIGVTGNSKRIARAEAALSNAAGGTHVR